MIPAAPPVVCVHGLTRNGRDFDALGEGFGGVAFRVICPDLPGRGHSDWLDDPMLYQAQHYVTALAHLLAWIGRDVAWVGTSLGGICGMLIAAMDGSPITPAGVERCRAVHPGRMPWRASATTWWRRAIRRSWRGFPILMRSSGICGWCTRRSGPLSDAQWAKLARNSARALPDGRFTMHYDPRIAEPLRGHDPVGRGHVGAVGPHPGASAGDPGRDQRYPAARNDGPHGRHRARRRWRCRTPAMRRRCSIRCRSRRFVSFPGGLTRCGRCRNRRCICRSRPGPTGWPWIWLRCRRPTWFEFDQHYPAEMAEKRRLLATARQEVFAALPVSDAARAEALRLVVAALVAASSGLVQPRRVDAAQSPDRGSVGDWTG